MSQNNNKIAVQGWTIMTECLGGDELSWSVEDGDNVMPEIYDDEVQAWQAIAQHQIDIMRQFIDDVEQGNDADPEMVDWAPTVYPAKIVLYEDGELIVYHGEDDAPQPVIETTLSEWRENR